MKKLLLSLVILASAPCRGQVFPSGGPVVNNMGQPVGNAKVAICSTNPGVTTPPCSSLAQTYTDNSLASTCTLNPTTLGPLSGIGCTNPGTTNSRGNYNIYASPNLYYAQFYGSNVYPYVMPFSTVSTAAPFPWLLAPSFTGSDIGAKINAASATCTSNLPCHIVIPPLGQQTFTTTINYVNNMTIECTNAGGAAEQIGGSAVPTVLKYTGSTIGINMNGATQPVFRNCGLDVSGMSGSATGLKVTGASPIVENNYFIGGPVGTKVVNIGLSDGTQFKGNSGFEFLGDYLYIDHAIDAHVTGNLAYGYRDPVTGISNTTSRSLVIDTGSSSIHITTLDYGSAGLHGIVVQNTLSGLVPPTYIWFDDVTADCSYGDGWLFDSSLSLYSLVISATDSWAAGAGQNCDGTTTIRSVAQGIHISGGIGYKFSGMKVRGNAYNGVLIDNGLVQDVDISHSKIYGNNVANNSDAHGIYAPTFINGFTAEGNTITNNYQSLPSGNQRYGIKFSGNGENVNVIGNNLGGNVTGPILYPTSFGFNVVGNSNNNTPMDSVFSGNVLAYGVASHGQGGCLIPQFGSVASFLMGLGINGCFDGTNFHFYTDATNNGGALLIGNQQGGGGLYSVPTNGTPASDQTVTPASLSANKLFSFTPTTFTFVVNPIFSSVVGGGIQCATFNNAGTLSGTGAACGSGIGGGVTSVGGTAPVVSSGGTTPVISISGVTGLQGNGSKLQLSTGSVTPNFLPKFDANSNTINSLFKDGVTSNLGEYDGTAGFAVPNGPVIIGGGTVPAVVSGTTSSYGVGAAGTGSLVPTASQMGLQWNGLCWLGTFNNSATTCLPTRVSASFTISSSGVLSLTGGGTRTWKYDFLGKCQGGMSGASVNFPTTNAPTLVPCGTSATGKWQIPTSTTVVNYWVDFLVPAGHTGNYSVTDIYDSTDTVNTATAEIQYDCIAAGTSSNSLSWTDTTVALNFAPSVSGADKVATATINPTCADGSHLYVQLVFSTGSMTQPINQSGLTLAIQANN